MPTPNPTPERACETVEETMSEERVTCPECNGDGQSHLTPVFVRRIEGAPPVTDEQAQQLCDHFSVCSFCKGKGKVPAEQMEWRETGRRKLHLGDQKAAGEKREK